MIISIFNHEKDYNNLKDFIKVMLEEWRDNSSLRMDGTCCTTRPDEDVYKEYFNRVGDDGDVLLLKDKDKIIGTLVLDYKPLWLKTVYIHLLNIHPDNRRSGGARKLIAEAIYLFSNKGGKKLILKTWPDNYNAISMFKKMGFFEVSKEEGKNITMSNYLPMIKDIGFPDYLKDSLLSDSLKFNIDTSISENYLNITLDSNKKDKQSYSILMN